MQLVHTRHSPPVRLEQGILPCDLTGDLSSRAAGSLSFLSEAPPLKNAVLACGIQMKQGRCIVVTGCSRGNHAIWKTQRVLLDSAKAEMQQQELPHSSLAFPFHQSPGSRGGGIPWQTAESPQGKYSKLQRFASRPIPEGEHGGSHKLGSRGASW